jgi:hypothetical protein
MTVRAVLFDYGHVLEQPLNEIEVDERRVGLAKRCGLSSLKVRTHWELHRIGKNGL